MRLSACLLAGGAPERVAAALAPLRPVLSEVVVGLTGELLAEHLDGYRRIADRVAEVGPADEGAGARLHSVCTGDWILHLDEDEVPSAELVGRLPALIGDPRVGGYALPRAWLFPDGSSWLDEVPWWPDFQLRLVRNERLLAPPDSAGPVVAIEAPLYHLGCLLATMREREAAALVREVARPGVTAPGGLPLSAYDLPERYSALPRSAVPPGDRAALDAVLRSDGAASVHRAVAGRATTEAGTSDDALIEPLERDLRFRPGVLRAVAFRVANRSGTRWPAATEADASERPIRLAYRWQRPDGDELEGPRTPFPVAMEPGEARVVALQVTAPDADGAATLIVDVVQEQVRWYGAECRLAASIVPAPVPPSRRVHRAGTRRGRLLRRRSPGMAIPRVVHRVWLGSRPIPAEHAAFGESWRRHHPGWEMRLWTDADALRPPGIERARNLAERADLVRYEVLRRHGGVYVDTDVECLRPIDDLLDGVEAFAAYEVPGRLCNAVIGAVPGHAGFERAVELAEATVGTGVFPEATATLFLTRVLEAFPDATLFGPERFYPYLWDEPPRPASELPEAYAIHHWAMSWVPGTSPGSDAP